MAKQKTAPATATPTFLERIEWMIRLVIPIAVGSWIHLKILGSHEPSDIDTWESFQWGEIATGKFESLDLDILARNLVTPNVLTKGMASLAILLGSLYFADYLTTKRRRTYAFLRPFGSSRRRRVRFWLALFSIYAVVVLFGIVLVARESASVKSIHRLQVLAHSIIALVLVIANDGFAGFGRVLPELRTQRKQRRDARKRRKADKERRRREEERAAREHAEAIRQYESTLDRLRTTCAEIDEEIERIESSSQPADVIEQQVAELYVEQKEVLKQLEDLESQGEPS